MANEFQARFDGGAVVMECDDRWSCCQRAQAAAKVDVMNQKLKATPTPQIQPDITHLEAAKTNCQNAAKTVWNRCETKADKEAHMKKVEGADCVADGRKQNPDDLQQDHPLDAKWGGEADSPTLRQNMIPTDKAVNGAFGTIAKNLGNKMLAKGIKHVESFSLICPPSSPGCPKEDHSTGRRSKMPEDKTKNQESTAKANYSAFLD